MMGMMNKRQGWNKVSLRMSCVHNKRDIIAFASWFEIVIN